MEQAWSGPHAPGHFSALQDWQGLVREPPVGAHILHIYEDPDREIEAASLFVIRERAGPRGSAASAAPENWPPFDDASRKPALTRIDWSETERSRSCASWT